MARKAKLVSTTSLSDNVVPETSTATFDRCLLIVLESASALEGASAKCKNAVKDALAFGKDSEHIAKTRDEYIVGRLTVRTAREESSVRVELAKQPFAFLMKGKPGKNDPATHRSESFQRALNYFRKEFSELLAALEIVDPANVRAPRAPKADKPEKTAHGSSVTGNAAPIEIGSFIVPKASALPDVISTVGAIDVVLKRLQNDSSAAFTGNAGMILRDGIAAFHAAFAAAIAAQEKEALAPKASKAELRAKLLEQLAALG